jgi:hypothetical protein
VAQMASRCSTRSTDMGRFARPSCKPSICSSLDGQDFRPLSLGERKKRLARLLARVTPGVALCDHTDAAGELVFGQACAMGLEGILSKRLAAPYRVRTIGRLDQGQKPRQPRDGKTPSGALAMGP